jgi:hypothetical protein
VGLRWIGERDISGIDAAEFLDCEGNRYCIFDRPDSHAAGPVPKRFPFGAQMALEGYQLANVAHKSVPETFKALFIAMRTFGGPTGAF